MGQSSDEDVEIKSKSRRSRRHSTTKDNQDNGTYKEIKQQANETNEEMEEVRVLTPAKRPRRSRKNDENQSPVIDMEISSTTKRKTPKRRSGKSDAAEEEAGTGDVAIGNLIDLGEPTPLPKPARSRRTRLTQEFSQLSGENYIYFQGLLIK